MSSPDDKPKPAVSPAISPATDRGALRDAGASSSSLAKRGLPKPKSTASLRGRTESTSSYGSPIKSRQFAKLQRQLSRDVPEGGRPRTTSTSSQVSYIRARSASLSLAHGDSIPFHIAPPAPEDIDPDAVPWWSSKRLMLSFVCFVGFFCLYSLRVNLSTAIVCMVKTQEKVKQSLLAANVTNSTTFNGTYSDVNNGTSDTSFTLTTLFTPTTIGELQCPEPDAGGASALVPEFDWDKKLQGFILGAFFWGYTIMQMPSGFLSDRFGPRITISCGMFPVAILTIISPWLARGSPYLLLIGRVAIGFGEAMMYPGMQSLWSKWAPPHERSRLVGFAFGGSQLGNALTFPFASLLCAYGFDGGWPSVFYVLGFVGFLWCCWFVFFARDSPGQMAGIKPIEQKYIEQSLGTWGQTVEDRLKSRKGNKPWKKIFTSGPVWAILLTNACSNYGAYMVLTQLPTFMKEVLHFDIKSNGLFSMIPFLVFWIFVIIAGQIADVLISKKILSIEWTRKLCGAIGCIFPGIFLVLTGYMDCNHQMEAVILLTLAMAFCGFQFSAFFINHGDIAPRYAGTVFGFTNCGASVPGIIAPYIVGAVTPNKTREEWLVAFYIAAAIYMVGAIIYVILAKGEVQDWAHEDVEEWENKGEDYPLKGISEEHEHDHDDEKEKLANDRNNGVMFE